MNQSVQPTVSVVMITYNQENCIAEAIKGVVKQKFDGTVELLILDDCSTDGTGEVCREWQARYPDVIRYVRNENNLGFQRNYMKAFGYCRGRYVALCDADDYWFYSRKLAVMVGYMDANPDCAITFHRVVNYYTATGEKSLSNGGTKADTTIADLCRSNYITNLSVMYRRELVDLARLPGWIAECRLPDYVMHMLYARHGRIHYFSRPMGVYRKAAGCAWSDSERFAQLNMSLAVREHLIDEFSDEPDARMGLLESVAAIVNAMHGCAADDVQRDFARQKALQYGIDISTAAAQSVPRKRLLSRVRGIVSRIVPLPRP